MPAKLDRCVEKVKRKGGVKNPWAVCREQLGSDADIRRRSKRKKNPFRGVAKR